MSAETQLTEYGKIRDDFSQNKLADLCIEKIGVQTGPFGSQLHNEDYVEVGTPIITVEHLGDNRILHQNTPFVSDKDKERLSKYHLQNGDIVFSRVGSVDRRALVRKSEDGWLFSGRCLRVRVNKSKIDSTYLSYFFGLEYFKNYIRSIAVGATMPSINTKILSDVPIYYPDLDEQKIIGNILCSLDDKIELNRQINQTLKQIAQAIFKSWFVDFEPVKAKIAAKENGQDPERAAMCAISGKSDAELNHLPADQLSQLATTAALFPDELVESELGMIPRGWEVSTFGDIAINVREGANPKKEPPSTPYVGLEHIEKKQIYISSWSYADKVESHKSQFSSGDMLFGKLRPYFHKVCHTPFRGICSTDILVIRTITKDWKGYVQFLLFDERFVEHANVRSTGTRMPRASWKDMSLYNIAKPSSEIVSNYTNIVSGFNKLAELKVNESRMLTQLRDTLLPKLLSGEISVAETQAKIEAAV